MPTTSGVDGPPVDLDPFEVDPGLIAKLEPLVGPGPFGPGSRSTVRITGSAPSTRTRELRSAWLEIPRGEGAPPLRCPLVIRESPA